MHDRNMDLETWYRQRRPVYERLGENVRRTLEERLGDEEIQIFRVESRAKKVGSFLEKATTKQYRDPRREVKDLCGVRVIAFIEADLSRIAEAISRLFKVIEEPDKQGELGTRRVGYRSVHLVCELGPDRLDLEENRPYEGLAFEVQVRTLLQHAWAEIEHDRNYKFYGELPKEIERRLFVVAGVLELVDREFSEIAENIEEIRGEYAREAKEGREASQELNELSLQEFFSNSSRELEGLKSVLWRNHEPFEVVIGELRRFSVRTLGQVSALFTSDFVEAHRKFVTEETRPGLLRSAMLFADIDRYFREAWADTWQGITQEAVDMLSQKYGPAAVLDTLGSNGVDTIPNDR